MMNKKERPELLADLAQLRLKQAELESLLGIEGDIAAPLKILDSDIQSQPIIFYSEILNKIPGLAYYKDKHGVYIMANLAFTNALGLDLEQIVGKTDFDLIPVEKAERYWLEDQRILSGLDPILVIEEDILSEGHPICISYRKAPLKDHKGQIVGLIGVGFDISEHKLIEKELEQERLLIRTVIDNIPDQIFVRDRNCRFVLNNLSDARVMGVEDPETLVGKSDDDYYPANLSASYQADDRQVMDSGQPLINREELSISAEGQQRWVSTTKVPLQDVNGEVVGLVGIARDNTESKKNKQLLTTQRDLALALAQTSSMPEALAICLDQILGETGMDCGGVYLIDQATSGLKLAYVKGLSDTFIQAKSFFSADSENTQLVMRGKSLSGRYQNLPIHPLDDQQEGLKGFLLIPISYQEKVIGCFNLASHSQDGITADRKIAADMLALQVGSTIIRILTEEKLVESRNELETLFDTINDYLVVFDQAGKIIKVNQQVIEHLGYSEKELIGEPVLALHPKELHPQAAKIIDDMLSGRSKTCLLDLCAKDGALIPVETRVDAGKIRGQPVWIGISRDISERKQADEKLKYSNEQLALAIEGSRAGLWDWMVQTGELEVNERSAEILGYTLQEISPMRMEPWVRLCHPDDLKLSEALFQHHFSGQTPFYECELRMLHKDGHWVWVHDRARVTEWDAKGKPVRIIGTHMDITERRVMQEKLSYRLDFEKLLTGLSTRFINLDSDRIDGEIINALQDIGEFEQVDRSYSFLINYAQNTMTNTHEWCREGIEAHIEMLQNLPLTTLPTWIKKMEENEPIVVSQMDDMPYDTAAEKGFLQAHRVLSVAIIPIFVNYLLIGFTGYDSVNSTKEWGQDSIALLQQFGNILGNLLERQRVNKALQRSEEQNAAILNAIPDNILRINQDGLVFDVIASDSSSLIIPAEDIRGANVSELLGNDIGLIVLEKIQNAISSGRKETMEYQIPVRNQAEHFEARIVATGADEVIAIVRNVSERARLEQMKTDFINRATHDLRTPVTTILLMVNLLEGECTPEEKREYWAVLKEELERERSLIEDLLTMGRLENNQWGTKLQAIDPFESLHSSIQAVSAQALQKHVSIHQMDAAEKFLVVGDSKSLVQIFVNLIHNGVKFTPAGGKVDIAYFQRDGKGYFRIEDNGIGIPAEDLPNLFNRFFRARNATDNEIPGSGIGLFIVKSMIEHFGGQITIESHLGSGTSIEFWLPIPNHPGL